MRFSHFAYLAIPVLAMASPPVHLDVAHQRRAVEEAAAAAPALAAFSAASTAMSTVAPTPTSSSQEQEPEENDNILELRQAAGPDNLGATLTQAVQKPAVTSNWVQTNPDPAASWSLVIYTQTFASPVTQQLTAGAGSIGLGTHTGEVGVVKASHTSGGIRVLPVGTMATTVLGVVGMVAGMCLIVL